LALKILTFVHKFLNRLLFFLSLSCLWILLFEAVRRVCIPIRPLGLLEPLYCALKQLLALVQDIAPGLERLVLLEYSLEVVSEVSALTLLFTQSLVLGLEVDLELLE
jgi:hypothetical protein